LELRTGFEPAYHSFADCCLTTQPPQHYNYTPEEFLGYKYFIVTPTLPSIVLPQEPLSLAFNHLMILPDLVLPSLVNLQRQFHGMDCLIRCRDRDHFKNFPYPIEYRFNSRGFRGPEWPESRSDLQNAIWCLGDSYTTGIGSPLPHTWPVRLGSKLDKKVINVSLAGCSNEWIADTVERIVADVDPRHMVIMWSLTRRRQHPDTSLSPENRRLSYSNSQVDEDWENFLHCKKRVDTATHALQFAIPEFHAGFAHLTRLWNDIRGPDWPEEPPTFMEELHNLPPMILAEIKDAHQCYDRIRQVIEPAVIRTPRLDHSRDGYHFGLITAEWVASQAADRLDRW
jgi:hypothetical protein